MLSKESLASFSGDFTDPTAVFGHIAGKTFRELQLELAREAWGAGTPEIPYPFDDLWKEFHDRLFPIKEAKLLLNDLHEEFGRKRPDDNRSWKEDPSVVLGLRNSILRKKFPNITLPIDKAERTVLNSVNNQTVPLYGAIQEKIREATMSVARKFGATPSENKPISLPRLVEIITGKTPYALRVEQARKAWDACPDPRIPYPTEEVFKIHDGVSLERALLDELNKKIVLPKYGFELERFPVEFDTKTLVMERYFPNADSRVKYDELMSRVCAFINVQEPQIVADIRESFQSSAREAFLGPEEPDAKRVKNDF